MNDWTIQTPIRSINVAIGRLRGGLLADALGQIPDDQVDAELHERGITRAGLFHPLHAVASHRGRLARMLGAWQIDTRRVVAEHWRELKVAVERCDRCGNAHRCESWLGWGQLNAAPMSFCPNALLWLEIASEQGVELPASHRDSRSHLTE
jgi:hypothetical protein